MTEIRIKRDVLKNRPGSLRPFSYMYSYTTPEDITWHRADGTMGQGPREGDFIPYGQSLGSLRDMLHEKFGRSIKIIEEWKI